MQPQTLETRVERLEIRMVALEQLPDKVDALTTRVDTLTTRVDGLTTRVDGLKAQVAELPTRAEMGAATDKLRRELNQRIDERAHDVMNQARALHEDMIDRIKIMGEAEIDAPPPRATP